MKSHSNSFLSISRFSACLKDSVCPMLIQVFSKEKQVKKKIVGAFFNGFFQRKMTWMNRSYWQQTRCIAESFAGHSTLSRPVAFSVDFRRKPVEWKRGVFRALVESTERRKVRLLRGLWAAKVCLLRAKKNFCFFDVFFGDFEGV